MIDINIYNKCMLSDDKRQNTEHQQSHLKETKGALLNVGVQKIKELVDL